MLSDEQLTDVERRLVEAARTGQPFTPAPGQGLDVAAAGSWGENRTIRAEVIVSLLTGERTPASGAIRQVWVNGARITGELNLRALTVSQPLTFTFCVFDEEVVLTDARTMALRFAACQVPGISAQHARIDGHANLIELVSDRAVRFDSAQVHTLWLGNARLSDPEASFTATRMTVERDLSMQGLSAAGGVDLSGARVGGDVDLNGAQLHRPGGVALHGWGLSVGRSLTCRDGFAATGEVNLANADVGGEVDFSEAALTHPSGMALQAPGLVVGQSLAFSDAVVEGQVMLRGATVDGDLALGNVRLRVEGDVPALYAEDLTVRRHLSAFGLRAVGGLYLVAAHVGGALLLPRAQVLGTDTAVDAYLLEVDQDVSCADGFVAHGRVSLVSARVGGDVSFVGAHLYGPRTEPGTWGTALDAADLRADLSVRCEDGFVAIGTVRFNNAVVGGTLRLDDAVLSNPGGDSMIAEGMTASHLFGRGLVARGDVVLTAAHVKGETDLDGARLLSPGRDALAARGLTVDGDLWCRAGFSADGRFWLRDVKVAGRLDLHDAVLTDTGKEHLASLEHVRASVLDARFGAPPTGVLDLTDARVDRLVDRPESWPDELRLRGFGYDRCSADDEGVSVEQRLTWLRRHQDGRYEPGPYDELAAAYRRSGDVERARKVAVAKQIHRRSRLHVLGKTWNWFLRLTVGYGYHPGRAALWLLGLLLGGWLAFFLADRVGAFRAAGPDVPAFDPLLYTVDVLLPVGDLGQQTSWLAGGAAAVVTVVLTLFGWLLAAAVVAGLSNVVRRE